MIVGDIVYNDSFDVGCHYAIYEDWLGDNEKLLFDTHIEGKNTKPLDAILDRTVSYISIHDNKLIVEVC